MAAISNDWLEPLKPEFGKAYYAQLYRRIKDEYSRYVVYPPSGDMSISIRSCMTTLDAIFRITAA